MMSGISTELPPPTLRLLRSDLGTPSKSRRPAVLVAAALVLSVVGLVGYSLNQAGNSDQRVAATGRESKSTSVEGNIDPTFSEEETVTPTDNSAQTKNEESPIQSKKATLLVSAYPKVVSSEVGWLALTVTNTTDVPMGDFGLTWTITQVNASGNYTASPISVLAGLQPHGIGSPTADSSTSLPAPSLGFGLGGQRSATLWFTLPLLDEGLYVLEGYGVSSQFEASRVSLSPTSRNIFDGSSDDLSAFVVFEPSVVRLDDPAPLGELTITNPGDEPLPTSLAVEVFRGSSWEELEGSAALESGFVRLAADLDLSPGIYRVVSSWQTIDDVVGYFIVQQ